VCTAGPGGLRTVDVAASKRLVRTDSKETAMCITPFAVEASELFDVLPETTTHAAWIGDPGRIDRWEVLTGDNREIEEIVTNPNLLAGTAYWVHDALHALVLRNAARQQERAAEAIWDLNLDQYVVLVAP
jgi:hypothetical protein